MTSAHTSTRTLNIGTFLHTPLTELMVAGVVLWFGMLSVYGHPVQSQVRRGETFRKAQRTGLQMVDDGA